MNRDFAYDNKICSILLHDVLSNVYSVSRMVLKSTYPLYVTYSPPSSAIILHLALEPSAQERHGPVGAGPEEGHKNDQRDGTPLLQGKAEGVGAVQPGEEQAVGRPYSGLSVTEGGL